MKIKETKSILDPHFYTNKVYNVRIEVKGCGFMDHFNKILSFIKENNGIISTADVVKLAIDKKYLSIMTQRGLIERATRGVYVLLMLLRMNSMR